MKKKQSKRRKQNDEERKPVAEEMTQLEAVAFKLVRRLKKKKTHG